MSQTSTNVNIIPFESKDLGALPDLQPPGWQDLKKTFEYYLKDPHCFPFKYMSGKKITGIGASIIHKDIAWLGHIIVHPEFRKKGIGQSITQDLINFSHERYCNTLYLIATDLGTPVYLNAGFETETEYVFIKDIALPPGITPSEQIHPFKAKHKAGILELDKLVSGEDRAEHLESFLQGASVYMKDEVVEGFYLPAWGDGLILANHSTAGTELMKLRLMEKDTASFPAENIPAAAFLKELGFKPFKTAKRMRMGVKRTWKPGKIYNRIGGNLG
jgi:ribosomal protein S18 acetylase RimI-like enzyme